MKFWKVNSRKFFAVTEEDLLAPRTKRRRSSATGTDADDSRAEACNCDESLDGMTKELIELKAKVSQIFELTKESKVPLGLRRLLADAFKCKICRDLIRPPVMVTRCCKAMLGCDECVKTWYATDTLTKNCPACNTERGYVETMRLHGLDDLLTGLMSLEDL